MAGRLENKVAIITGGATGIGRAAAVLFAQEGAKVAIADRNAQEAERTVRMAKGAGGQAIFVETDVSKAAQAEAMVAAALTKFGKLDVLVNNAGVLIRTALPHEVSEMEWDITLNTNLRGAFLCCKYAIPHMMQRGGAIVNVSSGAGIRGTPEWVPYGVSKAGLLQFTRTLARAYAQQRIRANVIVPGLIDTPQARGSTGSAQAFDESVRNIPLGRAGTPEDVARMMLYLASEESSFVTGASFAIDGGGSA